MNLDLLKPRIESYIDFARKFPSAYRAAIVTYLLQVDAVERGISQAQLAPQAGGSTRTAPPIAAGDVHPAIAEIAAEVNVPAAVINRRLLTVVDDRPAVLWRNPEASKAKRTIAYTLLYVYVSEKLGKEGASIKEIRDLCIQKRCLDSANFMATIKRATDTMQLTDLPGGMQEVTLTGAGRNRAMAILQQEAQNVPPGLMAAPAQGAGVDDGVGGEVVDDEPVVDDDDTGEGEDESAQ